MTPAYIAHFGHTSMLAAAVMGATLHGSVLFAARSTLHANSHRLHLPSHADTSWVRCSYNQAKVSGACCGSAPRQMQGEGVSYQAGTCRA